MISEKFIEECKNRANANRLGKITIDGVEKPITNSDNLQSINIDSGCYIDGNIIGSVYAKCLKANFITDIANLSEKTIHAQIGIKYADNSTEYINMGKYTIERPNNEITANMSQITAYDDLYTNLDNKYVCEIDYSKGNITVKDLYIDVCKQLGLTPKTTSFLNDNIPIEDNPFTNGEKNRTVLQTICKISCSFVDIDVDTDEIDLCWLSQNEEPDYIFRKNDYVSVEGGQVVCGPINCLIIKNSQIDSENVTKKDDEDIAINGEHSITISEDYILHNEELRQLAITNIWNRVHGMKYVDCKLTTYYGKSFLILGNKIRVYIDDDNTQYFDTYVLKHNFTYDGAFSSVIESPALTQQEIKSKQDVSLGQALLNTQIDVDKQNKRIDALVSEQTKTSEKVTNLELNLDGIDATVKSQSTTITELQKGQQTLEKDLSTTNSNLNKTNENVSNLDKKIDGVSASFDDFKDNEYIKSIENLQDQIDGAIQFWNGAEIPTVNNYPANEWATENDRNNHRADIYTVIEDVEGELKQGKSYRFDKVNGVWQWIELTDNELSAVQALAEKAQKAADQAQTTATEANNRSKENSTSITKLQENDVQLKLGLDSIDERVHTTETITSDLKPTDEARGTELVLKKSAGMTLLEFEAEGNVRQETKTSDNLFYINWLKAPNITIQNDEAIGTALDFHNNFHKDGLCVPNTNYGNKTLTISITAYCEESLNDTNGLYFYVIYSDDTKSIVGPFKNNDTTKKTVTFTTNGKSIKSLDVTYGNGPTNIWHISEIMVVEGNTPKEYEPYVLMPSPDFPSDVETVEGIENLFDINALSSVYPPSSNLDYKIDGNKLTLTAVGSTGAQYVIYQMSNLEATETYTISFKAKKIVKGTSGYSRIYLRVYYSDDDKNYQMLKNIEVTTPTQGQEYHLSGQFSGHKYYKLYFYNNNDTPVMLGEQTEYYDIQLKKGTEANPFVPFGKYIIFKKMGLNLYDYKDTIVVTNSTVDDEGFVTMTGDNTNGTSSLYSNYWTNNLNVKPNEEYSIVLEIKNVEGEGTLFLPSNQNENAQFNSVRSVLSSLKSNSIKIYKAKTISSFLPTTVYGLRTFVGFEPGQSGSITFRISVLKDTTITEENFVYEPFVEAEQLNIDFKDNFVGKLTDEIKDRLYYQNRHIYIEKKVGRVTINSSSMINITEVNSKGLVVKPPNKKYSNNNGTYSDRAKYAIGSEKFKANTFYENRENFVFVGTPDDTLETIQAKFNGGLLYYALATPEIIDLGEYDLSTFEGTNYIQLLSKLETELYCKYARYTEAQEIYQTKDGMLDYYNKYETDTQILLSKNEIESHVQEMRTLVDENGQALSQVQNQVEQTITSTNAQLEIINETLENGVTKLKNMLVTVDIDGMKVATDLSKVSTLISNNQFSIKTNAGDYLAFFGYDEVEKKSKAQMDNLLVTNYFTAGYHRTEKFTTDEGEKRTGHFYNG